MFENLSSGLNRVVGPQIVRRPSSAALTMIKTYGISAPPAASIRALRPRVCDRRDGRVRPIAASEAGERIGRGDTGAFVACRTRAFPFLAG
jgi:hypothetical protein